MEDDSILILFIDQNSAVLAGESSTAKTSLSQAILAAANNLVTEAPNPVRFREAGVSFLCHDR